MVNSDVPDGVLAVTVQRVLLVMTEHFKHNGAAFNVLDEGLRDLHGNLNKKRRQAETHGLHSHPTWTRWS